MASFKAVGVLVFEPAKYVRQTWDYFSSQVELFIKLGGGEYLNG